MSDFVAIFDTVVVRKDQIVSIELEDDWMTNHTLDDCSEEKKKFYILTVKTDCFDCDLVRRYDSRDEAIDDFRRISHEVDALFSRERRFEDDPRFKSERKQFVRDI